MHEHENLTASDLLAELDLPVAVGRRKEILEAFADALEPLYRVIADADRSSHADGNVVFAIFHLAGRSVSDLLAAGHLASHAYLQQAYGAMRPVYENCDLLELVARDPAEAAEWVNTEKPWATFSPRAVRGRLKTAPDPVYSHITESGTHPRFAGSRLSGVMQVAQDEASTRTLVFRVGSFFPEHPAAVHIYGFLFESVVRLGFKLRHLTLVSERTTHDTWCDAFLESAIAVRRGCKIIHAELVALDVAGEGTGFLETVYTDLVEGLQPGGRLRTGDPCPEVEAIVEPI
jgi:hypothetical protein